MAGTVRHVLTGSSTGDCCRMCEVIQKVTQSTISSACCVISQVRSRGQISKLTCGARQGPDKERKYLRDQFFDYCNIYKLVSS